jgi:hypothetical protein
MALESVVIVCLLVAFAARSTLAAAPAAGNSRMLLQTQASCPSQIPACRRCSTRLLDSVETHVCMRCLRGYVGAMSDDGKSFLQCGGYPNLTGRLGTTRRVLHITQQLLMLLALTANTDNSVTLPAHNHDLIQLTGILCLS